MRMRAAVIGAIFFLSSLSFAQGTFGKGGVFGKGGFEGGASGGGGGFSVVHSTYCTSAGNNTALACPIPSTTAGHGLVLVQTHGFGTANGVVCDGGSCPGTSVDTFPALTAIGSYGAYAVLCNVSAGVTNVTMTLGATDWQAFAVVEISGNVTSSCLDGSNVTTTGTTSFSVGPTGALAQSNEFGLGALLGSNSLMTPVATGWTTQINGNGNSGGTEVSVQTEQLSSSSALTYSGTTTNISTIGVVLTIKHP